MTEKHLLIPKIEAGIVIDHIPAGLGLKVLEIIHSYPEMSTIITTVGLNYSSTKIGKKDMVKMQTQALPPRIMQHLAIACAGISVKRVQDYRVVEKLVITVPETVVGTARCFNPGCITNHERDVTTRFRCVDAPRKRYQCAFCEGVFALVELAVIVPSHV
jgi:aspartate carbamoyltransferase regulatory subunit